MFKIGDKVVYVKGPAEICGHPVKESPSLEFGSCGVITSGPYPDPRASRLVRYNVRFDGQPHEDWNPLQEYLRLIDPPKQELGSWSEIQTLTKWNPTKVREPISI